MKFNLNNNKKQNTTSIQKSFFEKTFVNYFRPTFYIKSIEDINLDSLKTQGINSVICDLDNTLVPHYLGTPNKRTINFINDVKRNNLDFYLVSNNSEKRVTKFVEKLQMKNIEIDNFYWSVKKPLTKNINKIIEDNQLDKSKIIMIGDQLEMDILAANILHIQSILVEPVFDSGYNFNFFTNIFEKYIYKKLARFNTLEKGHYDFFEISDDFKIL